MDKTCLTVTTENLVSLLIFVGSWFPPRRKWNSEIHTSTHTSSSKKHHTRMNVPKGLLTCERWCLERLKAQALLGYHSFSAPYQLWPWSAFYNLGCNVLLLTIRVEIAPNTDSGLEDYKHYNLKCQAHQGSSTILPYQSSISLLLSLW